MGCVGAKVNILIYEGGTFDQMFQWKTGDPAVAVNLTGYTAALRVGDKMTDLTPLVSATKSINPWAADGPSGVYIDDPTHGYYRIYINDEDTTGICAAHKDIQGYYDVFLYSPAGEALLKMYGIATLKAELPR